MCLLISDSAQFRIDCLDVNIRQGDITSEDTDAIVASCNLDLDLSKGKSEIYLFYFSQLLEDLLTNKTIHWH